MTELKKKEVFVAFEFVSIGGIDTLNEKFKAQVIVESRWKFEGESIESYDPKSHWNPELNLENLIAGNESVKYSISRVNNDIFITEIKKTKGEFWQRLNLKNFPLDIQDLSIVLTSEIAGDKLGLSSDPDKLSFISFETIQRFDDQQKWRLFRFVSTSDVAFFEDEKKVKNKKVVTAIKQLRSSFKPPKLIAKCTTARLPHYWFIHAFFLIFLITVVSLGTFAINVKFPHFRLQTTYTLLLVSVSFKWVVNRAMPTIFYLTSLDAYHISCIVFVAMIGIWHSLIGSFWDYNTADDIDTGMVIAFSVIFILLNLVFMGWLFKAYTNTMKLAKIEAKYLSENKEYFINRP